MHEHTYIYIMHACMLEYLLMHVHMINCKLFDILCCGTCLGVVYSLLMASFFRLLNELQHMCGYVCLFVIVSVCFFTQLLGDMMCFHHSSPTYCCFIYPLGLHTKDIFCFEVLYGGVGGMGAWGWAGMYGVL